MPEGHSVHRVAKLFRENLVSQSVKISSPQGRFASAARLVSGQVLLDSRAIGKQMFLTFDNDLSIRIHLGIYGKWQFQELDGSIPKPVGQVRARFLGGNFLADLRGPTACEVLTPEEVKKLEARLGPDPLSNKPSNSEAVRFVKNVHSKKAPIGALLMDQSVISGIGNVYRAELLFRNRLNPYMPGNLVPEQVLLEIWLDAVKLMKIGVRRGVMLTRDDFLTGKVLAEDRHFVYKREGLECRVCGSRIQLETLLSRKLYFCPDCQR